MNKKVYIGEMSEVECYIKRLSPGTVFVASPNDADVSVLIAESAEMLLELSQNYAACALMFYLKKRIVEYDMPSNVVCVFDYKTDSATIARRMFAYICDAQITQENTKMLVDPYFISCRQLAGEYLHELGIPARLAGFAYLRYAIAVAVIRLGYSLENDVYPTLECEYDKSRVNIERAMRYAIENAWNRGNAFLQYKLFGYTIDENKGKPVVKEFVSMVAEHIRHNMPIIS